MKKREVKRRNLRKKEGENEKEVQWHKVSAWCIHMEGIREREKERPESESKRAELMTKGRRTEYESKGS